MNDEILQSLHDVHLPPEPSWWPPSLAVLLLLLAIISSVLFIFWAFAAKRKKRKIKKSIMAELKDYQNQYLASPDQARLQAQICALIRRVVILKNPNKNIASLSLAELDGDVKQLFPRSKNLPVFLELATNNRFHKDPSIDAQKLINLAFEHFKKCRL